MLISISSGKGKHKFPNYKFLRFFFTILIKFFIDNLKFRSFFEQSE